MIWNYLGPLVRSTRVSGRFACGFQTILYFADDDWVMKVVQRVLKPCVLDCVQSKKRMPN